MCACTLCMTVDAHRIRRRVLQWTPTRCEAICVLDRPRTSRNGDRARSGVLRMSPPDERARLNISSTSKTGAMPVLVESHPCSCTARDTSHASLAGAPSCRPSARTQRHALRHPALPCPARACRTCRIRRCAHRARERGVVLTLAARPSSPRPPPSPPSLRRPP